MKSKENSNDNWEGYKNYDHYYSCATATEINNWFKEFTEKPLPIDHRIYNIPCSFDIETSSYYELGQKRATMYVWSFCVNGSTIIGRTWREFINILDFISKNLNTKKNHFIIYVHNLGYEFQWMREWFKWEYVFAVKERRPVHASLPNGIEFKCSYILSNYALAYIGENLIKRYHVQKDVGALDYSLCRHNKTPLSEKELWYSVHDVQVVTSYIQEKIEDEGGISNIPLTNTGYVRRYCREYSFTQMESDPALRKKNKAKYHETMKSLRIQSKGEYDQLHQAFAGGFTHAAPSHSGKLLSNVGSADLASSYPSAMVLDKFPMGTSTFIGNCSVSKLDYFISRGYCCLFTVSLYDVNPKFIYENYISASKCIELSDEAVIQNGRVASAQHLMVTITEQDWDIIKRCYTFDNSKTKIYGFRFYPADYLPRPLILSILKLFANKTSLKGVEGKETEYMVSKNMINSAYGMSVTNIIRDLYEYSDLDGWVTEDADVTEQLTSYNSNYNRFLFYAWGVWVTAHARHHLWDAIFEFGPDFIYADTDSIKGLNFDKHKSFFILYNNHIDVKIQRMCSHFNIDQSLCKPKTKSGKTKTIGIFEREEDYAYFKTIGAKRYIYEYESGELLFTVSGVNKYTGTPYLLHEYSNLNSDDYYELFKLAYSNAPSLRNESSEALQKVIKLHREGVLDYTGCFDAFSEGLYFPPESTGKQTLTYIDDFFESTCRDYLGNKQPIFERSAIHMEPQAYYLTQTPEYIKFLRGYQDASI